jgi:tripartite-type tricarboxylate transporter receptor subunit TctC
MKLRSGLDIVHIPYKGTGPAMTEQIAGQVQVGLFNLIAGMPVVQSGRLRGLTVTGVKRASRLPDLPTFTEVGVAGLEDMGGHAMWLPSGVNKDIVARLHQEMVRAVQSPEVKARLEAEGAEIIANTPEQAAAIIRTDLDKWGEVVRKSGIKTN